MSIWSYFGQNSLIATLRRSLSKMFVYLPVFISFVFKLSNIGISQHEHVQDNTEMALELLYTHLKAKYFLYFTWGVCWLKTCGKSSLGLQRGSDPVWFMNWCQQSGPLCQSGCSWGFARSIPTHTSLSPPEVTLHPSTQYEWIPSFKTLDCCCQ